MAKNTCRMNENKCRKNIAQMLSLMGFKDNNVTAAVTVSNMLAKLRQNQENNNDGRHKLPAAAAADAAAHNNKNRSTNTRLVLNLDGKRCLFDQKSPSSVIVSLEPPHAKTLVLSCNKKSRDIKPSCCSKMIIGDHDHDHDHEDDAIMELTKADNTEIINSRNNVACSKNPKYVENCCSASRMNVGDDIEVLRSSTNNVVVYSENPSLEMIIHDELRADNVKDFITSVGGTKAKLFIEKKLTDTDVQKHQGRLLMPARQLVDKSDNLLTSYEKMIMRNVNQLSVTVFDPQTRKWKLNLGQWKMGSNINYVLKTMWFPLAEINELKQHMKIQLWSFRDVEDKLCLAVVRVEVDGK